MPILDGLGPYLNHAAITSSPRRTQLLAKEEAPKAIAMDVSSSSYGKDSRDKDGSHNNAHGGGMNGGEH